MLCLKKLFLFLLVILPVAMVSANNIKAVNEVLEAIRKGDSSDDVIESIKNSPEIMASFVDDDPLGGKNLLMYAAAYDRLPIAKVLLEYGTDVNHRSDYRGRPMNTPLIYASSWGHYDMVKMLLTHGSTIDIQGSMASTALMFAAVNGHKEVVKLLLDAGANTDLQDTKGQTALALASWYGHIEVVKLLVEAGADLDIKRHKRYSGLTALMKAQETKELDIVAMLADAGADLNIQDTYGYTLAHHMAKKNDNSGLEIVLPYCPNLTLREHEMNATASDLAFANGYLSTVDLLIGHLNSSCLTQRQKQVTKFSGMTSVVDTYESYSEDIDIENIQLVENMIKVNTSDENKEDKQRGMIGSIDAMNSNMDKAKDVSSVDYFNSDTNCFECNVEKHLEKSVDIGDDVDIPDVSGDSGSISIKPDDLKVADILHHVIGNLENSDIPNEIDESNLVKLNSDIPYEIDESNLVKLNSDIPNEIDESNLVKLKESILIQLESVATDVNISTPDENFSERAENENQKFVVLGEKQDIEDSNSVKKKIFDSAESPNLGNQHVHDPELNDNIHLSEMSILDDTESKHLELEDPEMKSVKEEIKMSDSVMVQQHIAQTVKMKIDDLYSTKCSVSDSSENLLPGGTYSCEKESFNNQITKTTEVIRFDLQMLMDLDASNVEHDTSSVELFENDDKTPSTEEEKSVLDTTTSINFETQKYSEENIESLESDLLISIDSDVSTIKADVLAIEEFANGVDVSTVGIEHNLDCRTSVDFEIQKSSKENSHILELTDNQKAPNVRIIDADSITTATTEIAKQSISEQNASDDSDMIKYEHDGSEVKQFENYLDDPTLDVENTSLDSKGTSMNSKIQNTLNVDGLQSIGSLKTAEIMVVDTDDVETKFNEEINLNVDEIQDLDSSISIAPTSLESVDIKDSFDQISGKYVFDGLDVESKYQGLPKLVDNDSDSLTDKLIDDLNPPDFDKVELRLSSLTPELKPEFEPDYKILPELKSSVRMLATAFEKENSVYTEKSAKSATIESFILDEAAMHQHGNQNSNSEFRQFSGKGMKDLDGGDSDYSEQTYLDNNGLENSETETSITLEIDSSASKSDMRALTESVMNDVDDAQSEILNNPGGVERDALTNSLLATDIDVHDSFELKSNNVQTSKVQDSDDKSSEISYIAKDKSVEISDTKLTEKSLEMPDMEVTDKSSEILDIIVINKSLATSDLKVTEKPLEMPDMEVTDKSLEISDIKLTDKSLEISDMEVTDKSLEISDIKVPDKSLEISDLKITDKSLEISDMKVTDKSLEISDEFSDKSLEISDIGVIDKSLEISDKEVTENSSKISEIEVTEKPLEISDKEVTEKSLEISDKEVTEKSIEISGMEVTEKSIETSSIEVTDKSLEILDIIVREKKLAISDKEVTEKSMGMSDRVITDKSSEIPDIKVAYKSSDIPDIETNDNSSDISNTEVINKSLDISDMEVTEKSIERSDIKVTNLRDQCKTKELKSDTLDIQLLIISDVNDSDPSNEKCDDQASSKSNLNELDNFKLKSSNQQSLEIRDLAQSKSNTFDTKVLAAKTNIESSSKLQPTDNHIVQVDNDSIELGTVEIQVSTTSKIDSSDSSEMKHLDNITLIKSEFDSLDDQNKASDLAEYKASGDEIMKQSDFDNIDTAELKHLTTEIFEEEISLKGNRSDVTNVDDILFSESKDFENESLLSGDVHKSDPLKTTNGHDNIEKVSTPDSKEKDGPATKTTSADDDEVFGSIDTTDSFKSNTQTIENENVHDSYSLEIDGSNQIVANSKFSSSENYLKTMDVNVDLSKSEVIDLEISSPESSDIKISRPEELKEFKNVDTNEQNSNMPVSDINSIELKDFKEISRESLSILEKVQSEKSGQDDINAIDETTDDIVVTSSQVINSETLNKFCDTTDITKREKSKTTHATFNNFEDIKLNDENETFAINKTHSESNEENHQNMETTENSSFMNSNMKNSRSGTNTNNDLSIDDIKFLNGKSLKQTQSLLSPFEMNVVYFDTEESADELSPLKEAFTNVKALKLRKFTGEANMQSKEYDMIEKKQYINQKLSDQANSFHTMETYKESSEESFVNPTLELTDSSDMSRNNDERNCHSIKEDMLSFDMKETRYSISDRIELKTSDSMTDTKYYDLSKPNALSQCGNAATEDKSITSETDTSDFTEEKDRNIDIIVAVPETLTIPSTSVNFNKVKECDINPQDSYSIIHSVTEYDENNIYSISSDKDEAISKEGEVNRKVKYFEQSSRKHELSNYDSDVEVERHPRHAVEGSVKISLNDKDKHTLDTFSNDDANDEFNQLNRPSVEFSDIDDSSSIDDTSELEKQYSSNVIDNKQRTDTKMFGTVISSAEEIDKLDKEEIFAEEGLDSETFSKQALTEYDSNTEFKLPSKERLEENLKIPLNDKDKQILDIIAGDVDNIGFDESSSLPLKISDNIYSKSPDVNHSSHMMNDKPIITIKALGTIKYDTRHIETDKSEALETGSDIALPNKEDNSFNYTPDKSDCELKSDYAVIDMKTEPVKHTKTDGNTFESEIASVVKDITRGRSLNQIDIAEIGSLGGENIEINRIDPKYIDEEVRDEQQNAVDVGPHSIDEGLAEADLLDLEDVEIETVFANALDVDIVDGDRIDMVSVEVPDVECDNDNIIDVSAMYADAVEMESIRSGTPDVDSIGSRTPDFNRPESRTIDPFFYRRYAASVLSSPRTPRSRTGRTTANSDYTDSTEIYFGSEADLFSDSIESLDVDVTGDIALDLERLDAAYQTAKYKMEDDSEDMYSFNAKRGSEDLSSEITSCTDDNIDTDYISSVEIAEEREVVTDYTLENDSDSIEFHSVVSMIANETEKILKERNMETIEEASEIDFMSSAEVANEEDLLDSEKVSDISSLGTDDVKTKGIITHRAIQQSRLDSQNIGSKIPIDIRKEKDSYSMKLNEIDDGIEMEYMSSVEVAEEREPIIANTPAGASFPVKIHHQSVNEEFPKSMEEANTFDSGDITETEHNQKLTMPNSEEDNTGNLNSEFKLPTYLNKIKSENVIKEENEENLLSNVITHFSVTSDDQSSETDSVDTVADLDVHNSDSFKSDNIELQILDGGLEETAAADKDQEKADSTSIGDHSDTSQIMLDEPQMREPTFERKEQPHVNDYIKEDINVDRRDFDFNHVKIGSINSIEETMDNIHESDMSLENSLITEQSVASHHMPISKENKKCPQSMSGIDMTDAIIITNMKDNSETIITTLEYDKSNGGLPDVDELPDIDISAYNQNPTKFYQLTDDTENQDKIESRTSLESEKLNRVRVQETRTPTPTKNVAKIIDESLDTLNTRTSSPSITLPKIDFEVEHLDISKANDRIEIEGPQGIEMIEVEGSTEVTEMFDVEILDETYTPRLATVEEEEDVLDAAFATEIITENIQSTSSEGREDVNSESPDAFVSASKEVAEQLMNVAHQVEKAEALISRVTAQLTKSITTVSEGDIDTS